MATFLEERQRVTDRGVLVLLEVSAPTMPDTLRIVNDTQDVTSNGVIYTGCPFGFKLPDDTTGASPRATLTIENVGRSITEDLEGLPPGDMLMAKIMIVSRTDPNTVSRSFIVPITSVSANQTSATAMCGYDYIMRQQGVRKRYNPFTAPGLF